NALTRSKALTAMFSSSS
ncbi:mannose-6-phosphate isomerase, class I, partial [Vibrio parahaemolyticus V-223/04]